MFAKWKDSDRKRPSLTVQVGRRASDPNLHGIPGAPATIRQSKRRIRRLGDNEKIFDLYYWEEVIQEDGAGGKVVVCRKKSEEDSEFKYVLKIRAKASIVDEDRHISIGFRQRLIRILNLPPHLGVTPIIEILEDEEHFYVVMEKAGGGSLVDHLLRTHKDGIMPEDELKQMMRDMLEAVGHVHKQGVVHRDIKPENFVVRRITADSLQQFGLDGLEPQSAKKEKRAESQTIMERVSLIDFDHAEMAYSPCSGSPKTDCVWGTQGFNAPEQYLGYSFPASDLWSLGVILYLFMTGTMPYDLVKLEKEAKKEHRNFTVIKDQNGGKGSWLNAVYDKIKEAPPQWDCKPWTCNKPCADFCQKMLSFDDKCRPQTAEEALRHPWLANDETQDAEETGHESTQG